MRVFDRETSGFGLWAQNNRVLYFFGSRGGVLSRGQFAVEFEECFM
jgi:hypothetical protein